MSDGSLFGDARQAFGFTDDAWRRFALRWSGLATEAELYGDTTEAMRGALRVADRLIVGGWHHPRAGYIGPDYLSLLARLNGRGPGESAVMRHALWIADHPPTWPMGAATGRTFQVVIGHYLGLGYDMPELLARRWMTADRIAEVEAERQAAGCDDRRLGELLRDFGGGALHVPQLDEAGFDRLLLAIEVLSTGDAIEVDGPAEPVGRPAGPGAVARFWPDLARGSE